MIATLAPSNQMTNRTETRKCGKRKKKRKKVRKK